MNKLLAVLKREYLQAVRKKMFIVMTFLLPFLMILLFLLPGMLMEKGMGTKKVVVLDGTGALKEAFTLPEKKDQPDIAVGEKGGDLPGQLAVEYVDASGNDVEKAVQPFLDRLTNAKGEEKLDGLFVIPGNALTADDVKLKYYSRSATDFMAQGRLSSRVNRAVQQRRLASRGITADDADKLLAELDVEAVQLSKSGEQKKGGLANFFVGFILIALLILPSFIYGLEIMRGIIQEKTDRVVEVLISSMTPRELLIGKIVGIALVGLTQTGVWMTMAGIGALIASRIASMSGLAVFELLRPATFIYFFIFFILAYLTYVCIYAIGGAVCNSEKEAQQLIAPITMIMMLPWFLMAAIITNPESTLAVSFSLAPVFGPLTMYTRTLVADPPFWHILVSIGVSILTIWAFFWATAKIFRIGILSYGKRPTIPELWRWLKVA